MHKHIATITLATLGLLQTHAPAAIYTVTNTNNSGIGSLREAINAANINPGTDFIEFDIPGAGVQTIFPLTPLPWIIGTTSINGMSQPGFAGTPLIEIAGDAAGVGAVGLQIFNNSSQVGWLTINGFDSHGIRISGSGNATVVGCYIGVSNSGLGGNFPNGGDGVFIDDSPNNNIGGTTASLRNVIGANRGWGVHIEGASATGNDVRGNYIGTDAGGASELFNGSISGVCDPGGGVGILNAPNNTVGGSSSAYRNVISANRCDNIGIFNSPGTQILGNYVGLNASGTGLVPLNAIYDTQRNIAVPSAGVTIGGTTAGARNVIGGTNVGIILQGNNNTVQGNYIGTNAAGTAALGTGVGVRIWGTDGNLIGGSVPGAGNVISGNSTGISIIFDSGAGSPNLVQGNYIGLNAAGTGSIANTRGIRIEDTASNNVIGGPLFNYRNFIAGNTEHGIQIGVFSSDTPSNNVIINNFIGKDVNTQPRGNGNSGIHISGGAGTTGNQIGDSTVGGRNSIAYNGGPGISIPNAATGTLITDNIIHDNGGIGIGLGPVGVTPNDVDDLDSGSNNLQNFPEFTSAVGDGRVWGSGAVSVQGSLNSTPSSSFRLELYANPACDHVGYGEGLGFLGFFDVTTNAGGDVSFSTLLTNTRAFDADWQITATARNLATNDTSEFSQCIAIDSSLCGPGAGNCYAVGGNGSPGCDTGDCCNTVCDIDPSCCDTLWDADCALLAVTNCTAAGTENAGDCYTANGSPGCYDVDCVAAVCAVDPYCCDTAWDSICATQALTICGSPCPGDIPLVSPGVVDVQDLLFMLGAWGDTGPPRPRADVAPIPIGDNAVNVPDLIDLLNGWGPCP